MNAEIERLKLPRGVWQELVKKEVPVVSDVQCSYPDHSSVRFQLYNDSEHVANFTLSFLQGCRGILVSHAMLVAPSYQGKGIAKKLQPIKDRVAKDLRVSLLLATVKDDNIAEKKVIKDWQHLDTFHNIKTGSNVELHVKKIFPDPPDEIAIDACGKDIGELVIDAAPPIQIQKAPVANRRPS